MAVVMKRFLEFLLILPLFCFADSWGRYAIVGSYVSDESDGVVGVYFQTLADQGSEVAAYAVVGGVYPVRTSTVSGDIVIPETLAGVPVRKIADGAFVAQRSLRSITLPRALREIGDRAFGYCTSLTNVTFSGEGLSSVGNCCFSNCVALVSIKFPRTLSYIASDAFALCDSLERISFEGNAPVLDPPSRDTQVSYFGEKRWNGRAPQRAVVHVCEGTYGWSTPYRGEYPEVWPLSHGFMNAHPLVVDRKVRGLCVQIATDN